jgi:hypothetical protein
MSPTEEAAARMIAAGRLLRDAEGRNEPSGISPTLLVSGVVSLVWQALEWQRGLRP